VAQRKTPSTRPPLERLAYIDHEIRQGRYPSLPALVTSLGVSKRTVLRDLNYLRTMLDHPIKYNRERRGYYYDGPAPVLPAVALREGELFALFVARKALAQYRGTPYEAALRSAFEKIRGALSDDVELYLDEWDRKLAFRPGGGAMPVDAEVWAKLAAALDAGWRLRIYYHTAYRDEKTWREVDPYFLFNLAGEWYLVAYCHLREQIRTFLPGRIEKIEVTDAAFTRPTDLTAAAFLQDSFQVETRHGSRPRKVRIRFAPAKAPYIRERRWHPSQQLEELSDGGGVLTLTTASEGELISWVMSQGAGAEVLAPPELREKVAAAARAMAANYDGPRRE